MSAPSAEVLIDNSSWYGYNKHFIFDGVALLTVAVLLLALDVIELLAIRLCHAGNSLWHTKLANYTLKHLTSSRSNGTFSIISLITVFLNPFISLCTSARSIFSSRYSVVYQPNPDGTTNLNCSKKSNSKSVELKKLLETSGFFLEYPTVQDFFRAHPDTLVADIEGAIDTFVTEKRNTAKSLHTRSLFSEFAKIQREIQKAELWLKHYKSEEFSSNGKLVAGKEAKLVFFAAKFALKKLQSTVLSLFPAATLITIKAIAAHQCFYWILSLWNAPPFIYFEESFLWPLTILPFLNNTAPLSGVEQSSTRLIHCGFITCFLVARLALNCASLEYRNMLSKQNNFFKRS